ncbi:MAG: hypothetical protein ACRDZ7_09860, partial [Acidimicrobiia bacterium]
VAVSGLRGAVGRDPPLVYLGGVPPEPVPFQGEALVIWGRVGTRPLVLGAVHYTAPASEPGVEVVLATKARGARPAMVRRLLAAGGRGVEPPGTVAWIARDRIREVHWHDGGLRIWAGVGNRSVTAPVPGWLLGEQTGHRSLPTRVFLAHVEVVAPEGSDLAAFAGHRHGVLFSTARLAGDPPRLRIPLPKRVEAAPEPS